MRSAGCCASSASSHPADASARARTSSAAFAVHRLMAWANDGADILARLIARMLVAAANEASHE